MGRFFNREGAIVAVLLLIAGFGIGMSAQVQPWLVAVIALGVLVILYWPCTIFFQNWILERYTEGGNFDRALALALDIRGSAMVRSERQKAMLNVAFVHMARGDYENALKNLRGIVTTSEQPTFQTVINASTGYCLAQLDRDLDQAEKLIASSLEIHPKEPIFLTFMALIRMKQNRMADARGLLEESLTLDGDLKLPHPGERPWMLAQVLESLGETAAARVELEKAKKQGVMFGKKAAERLAAG